MLYVRPPTSKGRSLALHALNLEVGRRPPAVARVCTQPTSFLRAIRRKAPTRPLLRAQVLEVMVGDVRVEPHAVPRHQQQTLDRDGLGAASAADVAEHATDDYR